MNEHQLLFWKIIEQAIKDIMACPHASLDYTKKYLRDSIYYDSRDAKHFINKDNDRFIECCSYLGIEPDFFEEKIYKYIRKKTHTYHNETINEMSKLRVAA